MLNYQKSLYFIRFYSHNMPLICQKNKKVSKKTTIETISHALPSGGSHPAPARSGGGYAPCS